MTASRDRPRQRAARATRCAASAKFQARDGQPRSSRPASDSWAGHRWVRPLRAASLRMTSRHSRSLTCERGGMPNWAEEVTAIATAVSAVGLLSAIGAAIYAGQQVREARIGRQAEMAADFFRRWNEGPLEETRRLVDQYHSSEALRNAFERFIAEGAVEAYVLYRELDYFEQLGALEQHGGFDFQ